MIDELKEGDWVIVNPSMERPMSTGAIRIFLYTDKNGKHICVTNGDEEKYKKGLNYTVALWHEVTKLTYVNLTDDEGNVYKIPKYELYDRLK